MAPWGRNRMLPDKMADIMRTSSALNDTTTQSPSETASIVYTIGSTSFAAIFLLHYFIMGVIFYIPNQVLQADVLMDAFNSLFVTPMQRIENEREKKGKSVPDAFDLAAATDIDFFRRRCAGGFCISDIGWKIWYLLPRVGILDRMRDVQRAVKDEKLRRRLRSLELQGLNELPQPPIPPGASKRHTVVKFDLEPDEAAHKKPPMKPNA